jgi:hypothetical protein
LRRHQLLLDFLYLFFSSFAIRPYLICQLDALLFELDVVFVEKFLECPRLIVLSLQFVPKVLKDFFLSDGVTLKALIQDVKILLHADINVL